MMRLGVFFMFVLSTAFSMELTLGMCTDGLDDLRACVFKIFDLNNDTQITWDEVAEKVPQLDIQTQNLLRLASPNYNQTVLDWVTSISPLDAAESAFYYCDVTNDGVLTMEDFTHENRTCITYMDDNMCIHCTLNGYQSKYVEYTMAMETEMKRREGKNRQKKKRGNK